MTDGDPRKGFDLLQAALQHLRDEPGVRGLELVVFGQLVSQSPTSLGFPIHSPANCMATKEILGRVSPDRNDGRVSLQGQLTVIPELLQAESGIWRAVPLWGVWSTFVNQPSSLR